MWVPSMYSWVPFSEISFKPKENNFNCIGYPLYIYVLESCAGHSQGWQSCKCRKNARLAKKYFKITHGVCLQAGDFSHDEAVWVVWVCASYPALPICQPGVKFVQVVDADGHQGEVEVGNSSPSLAALETQIMATSDSILFFQLFVNYHWFACIAWPKLIR